MITDMIDFIYDIILQIPIGNKDNCNTVQKKEEMF